MKPIINSSPQNRILELDALRGIAALMVVLFHFTLYRPEAQYGFKLGSTGVDLFFIISGFVILLTASRTTRPRDFIKSRFSRIYPAYWFCVCFTALLIVLYNLIFHLSLKGLFTQVVINMTMFQFYFRVGDIDGPYWTMIIEMLFYAIMLILIVAKRVKWTEYVSVLFVFIAFVYSAFVLEEYPSCHKFLNDYFPIINFIPLFCAGVFFYKMKTDKATVLRYVAVFSCLVVQCSLYDDGVRSMGFISHMEYNSMLTGYFCLFVLYINNKLMFIVNPVTVFLGQVSYSLYLVHQFISLQMIIPFSMNKLGLPFWVSSLFIALPISICIAFFINSWIEKPAMNYIRKHYA